jgi:HPt (histidine-containing phosphotransfer) domain-containing protein
MDEEAARQMIRTLWLKHRSLTLERLAVVQAAVDQLAAGGLAPDTRAEARSEAHKLRGILGTYGFADGSEVVGEAEDLLVDDAGPGDAAGLGARLAACARTLAEA